MDRLKPWANQKLQHRRVRELTKAMMVTESLVELVPMKDRFESSKFNGKDNGGVDHEEDEEGHSDDGNNSKSDGGNGNHEMRRNWPKISLFFAIKRNDKPEEAPMKLGVIM
ncbi:hypothetical protein Goari_006797, partial [Gossypium aridum]|nr:hypothetical protein [Gossypium aridum]